MGCLAHFVCLFPFFFTTTAWQDEVLSHWQPNSSPPLFVTTCTYHLPTSYVPRELLITFYFLNIAFVVSWTGVKTSKGCEAVDWNLMRRRHKTIARLEHILRILSGLLFILSLRKLLPPRNLTPCMNWKQSSSYWTQGHSRVLNILKRRVVSSAII